MAWTSTGGARSSGSTRWTGSPARVAQVLDDVRRLTSGFEFKSILPLLADIGHLCELAYVKRTPRGADLAFDAADEMIRCSSFVDVSIRQRSKKLTSRMLEIAENEDRRDLRCRAHERRGDMLRSRKPDAFSANRRALACFEAGKELRGRQRPDGRDTHVLRSPPLIVARCSGSDGAEFDESTKPVRLALDSSPLTLHQKARCLDGLSEAHAARYQSNGCPAARNMDPRSASNPDPSIA